MVTALKYIKILLKGKDYKTRVAGTKTYDYGDCYFKKREGIGKVECRSQRDDKAVHLESSQSSTAFHLVFAGTVTSENVQTPHAGRTHPSHAPCASTYSIFFKLSCAHCNSPFYHVDIARRCNPNVPWYACSLHNSS